MKPQKVIKRDVVGWVVEEEVEVVVKNSLRRRVVKSCR
jgi:hypothetical protein